MGTPFNPLPLAYAPTIDYLGVVMSYGAFEQRSMEKRLHAAKANQAQLAKFLYGRKGLTQTHRISMYRTCVRSAATYGFPAVSLTHKSLKALHAFELKTLQAIARSPRHITHETNQDLYTRTGLQPALSSGSRFLLSDDRIAPKPLKQQDYVWVAQNCYLLGLLRHV